MGCIAVIAIVVAGISGLSVVAGMPIWGVPVLVAAAAWVIGSFCLAVLGTAMDGAAKKRGTVRRLLWNWLIIVTAIAWAPLWLPFGWLLQVTRARGRAAKERTEFQEDWSSRRTRF